MVRFTILALLCGWLLAPSLPYDVIPVVFRGHLEAVEQSGRLMPLVAGKTRPVGLCLEVPPTEDSHGWKGTFRVGSLVLAEDLAASGRRTGTVCFDFYPDDKVLTDGEYQLCVEVKDQVDGSVRRPPCRYFYFRAGEWKRPWQLWERVRGVLGGGSEGEELVHELDLLREEAEALGLRLMPIQIELTAVHQLVRQGDVESLARALQRLEKLPPWLGDEAAIHWAGLSALQRARLLESLGERQDAWRALGEADVAMERIASPHWLGVTMHQAGLLAGQGAVRRAIERLRFALEECELAPCREDLVLHAQGQLAWRLPQQSDVTDGDLLQAAEILEKVTLGADADPIERANHLINLSWVRLRRGDAASRSKIAPALAQARLALEADPDSSRVRSLLGWADLVEAMVGQQMAEEEAGDTLDLATDKTAQRSATEICSALISASDAELAAWASACAARAARNRGDLKRAALLFDIALLHHEHLGFGGDHSRPPLGPGERAGLFYRAARVAAERGDDAGAWQLLSRLDSLTTGLEARRQCRDAASGDELAAWRALDEEAATIVTRLSDLEGPVAGAARALREAQIRDAKERLREIFETAPGCESDFTRRGVADLRLFVLGDELWVLSHQAVDEISSHRISLGGIDLPGLIRRLEGAQASRSMTDREWRVLAQPLTMKWMAAFEATGMAEVPVERTIRVALHGLLQEVPILALPLGQDAFFGHRYSIARVPAGARAQDPGAFFAASRTGAGTIILDPLGDLVSARSLDDFYRRQAPEASLLVGAAASVSAFEEHVARSTWLHVDSHGSYDAAFPELSGLLMADATLDMARLAQLEAIPRFVNLSGCRTGSWPSTADSGHYGLAGLMVRSGASWVIASRNDLDDRLAVDFNRAFYSAFFGSSSVPEAFRLAMAEVSQDYPAAAWSNLMLLTAPVGKSADSAPKGGNSSPAQLLHKREPAIGAGSAP